MHYSRDIHTQVEASSISRKSRHRGRSPEDDDNLSFDLSFQRVRAKFSGDQTRRVVETFPPPHTHTHTRASHGGIGVG